ncbi:MAG: sterol desaturase family protein [Panacagrimonas sp.]
MIESLATQWKVLPLVGALAVAYMIQLLIYVGVAAAVIGMYGTVTRFFGYGALLDDRPLRPRQIRDEMLWSLGTCGVCAAYLVACLKLSTGLWPASWVSALIQVLTFSIFYDFYFYWVHRLLHTRFLARFHALHHRSVRVTSWAVHCLHPVEALTNHLPVLLFMLVWPTGIGMVIVFQVLLMLAPAIGHSNFDPYPDIKWLQAVKRWNRSHQRHHQLGEAGNYGFLAMHWDAVLGTSYAPDKH